MAGIINFLLGFLSTAIAVLAVVYVFNKFTPGGVAALGKEPIAATVGGAK